MRHVAYGDPKRLFSFPIEGEGLRRFSDLTEAYLHTQLERGFHTLDFYKQLQNGLHTP
jgi:DNA repair protein RecO (recombination protein O)